MFHIQKNPEISIVIPVYNTGKTKLARCFDSILAQTFGDYEVILIDDGSSDDSGEICDEFCKTDSRFSVVHQLNSGVSSARNKGICESKGSYICFIDSDDYVKREYLKVLYTSIKKENADLSICGVDVITEQGVCIFSQQREAWSCSINAENTNLETIEWLLENRYFNYAYAKLYIGSVIRDNNLRFNTSCSLGEDTCFVMEYLRHTNSLTVCGKAQYLYIKYGTGTLTSGKSVDKYLKLMEVNCYLEEIFSQKNWISHALLKAIDERKLMCAEWAIQGAEQEPTWKNKVLATKRVVSAHEIQNALNRNGEELMSRTELRLFKANAPVKILIYRAINRHWKYYSNVLRRRIRRLVSFVRKRN